MKKIIIPLFVFICSCSNEQIPKTIEKKIVEKKVIYIQPLGDVNNLYIETVKNSVESFYGFKCLVREKKTLTVDLLAQSQTRYEASKILSKFQSKENILLLTEKDIATKKDDVLEYGIIGLGFRPGTTCVVSTHRIKRGVSKDRMLDRLKKVSIHEIGHNLGLEHCNKNSECLMNDARGTVKQIDKEKLFLCFNCKKIIS